MSTVAIVYNEPESSRYSLVGEEKAITGVLETVNAVHRSLLELGHQPLRVPLLPPEEQCRKQLKSLKVDLIFNLFEGFCGYPETEVLVPVISSELGLPYTGCPAEALTLSLDKSRTKALLRSAGISTPGYQLLNPQQTSLFKLAYPCIVKPRNEDASHGLTEDSVVSDLSSLEKRVAAISSFYGGEALVEEFIDGREFNATVMGGRECHTLPVSEIVYTLPPGKPRLLTFAAKWEPDSLYFQATRAECPAKVSSRETSRIASTAEKAFLLLGCRGYARVDMRMDGKGNLNVIEVNPNPDISPGSGAVRQAEAAGMSYTQFVARIMSLALNC